MKRAFNPFKIPVLWLFFSMPCLNAQQNDFQIWPSVQIGLQVLKKVDLQVEEEIRFKENCSQMYRQINDFGISYKLNKYIKTAVFYRIEAFRDHPRNYNWRQGLYADIMLKYAQGRFQIGYRTRFQSSRIEFAENEERMLDDLVNRNKLTIKYNIKNLPLNPFAEGEVFLHLKKHPACLSDYRLWIGVTYAPGKVHEISLKYGMDKELNKPDPLTAYILALNYAVNLKL